MGKQQTDKQEGLGTVGNTLHLQGKWPGSCYGDVGEERLPEALRLFTSGVSWSLLTVRPGLLQDSDTSSQHWQIP